MRICIAIYNHPEYYPPTLNAIDQLSAICQEITVVSRNMLPNKWAYRQNVTISLTGAYISRNDSIRQSHLKKIKSFYDFTAEMRKIIVKEKPDIVLLYDPIPVLSYLLISPFIRHDHKVWYHNHDIIESNSVSKYSVSWFASTYEKSIFSKLDIFTLPAEERKVYFPIKHLKGKYFFLPNLPAKHFYNLYYKKKDSIKESVNLIYQGSLGRGHGFEALINILHSQVNGKSITLTLVGDIHEDYKNELINRAITNKVRHNLNIVPRKDYIGLPSFTRNFDIGLAIHEPKDIVYSTGGTASNKIYEYAALGLPVLLYDSAHYKMHLAKYNWAFFTDLTPESLLQELTKICNSYPVISEEAYADFEKELNFEYYFSQVIHSVSLVNCV